MPPISHNYLEKLRKEVAEFEAWLATTQPQEDGSANPDDLKALYHKGHTLYQKSLALYQTIEDNKELNEVEEYRQDVNRFSYWVLSNLEQPGNEELKTNFTRANAIYLKALTLYRVAGTEGDTPQTNSGDDHASLSSS